MAAAGAVAAAIVPTPAVIAQGGRASRPSAGWVHVELHAASWKCTSLRSLLLEAWASTKIKTAPHEWHRAWSNGHARRVGMVVLSKPTGAGAPERN